MRIDTLKHLSFLILLFIIIKSAIMKYIFFDNFITFQS